MKKKYEELSYVEKKINVDKFKSVLKKIVIDIEKNPNEFLKKYEEMGKSCMKLIFKNLPKLRKKVLNDKRK